MDKKYDLSWGNAKCVREAFLEAVSGESIDFNYKELEAMDYPPHEGDLALIELTRKIIFNQTNKRYTYVLLTNGATGAITIALRAYYQQNYEICHIQEPPFFPLYPSMVHASGFKTYSYGNILDDYKKKVILIDSPSNPLGLVRPGILRTDLDTKIVLDAVYHNNIYMPVTTKLIDHDILIGSYSKLTGLNGIRVGWIATNDHLLYHRLLDLVTAEYSGLDIPGTAILNKYLTNFSWDAFETGARFKLDTNREQWSKLEKYFGGEPVKSVGMFYYSKMDKKCKELMEKSGIQWTYGSACGTDDNYSRFNLGQTNKTIMRAVKEVLRNDKV